MPYSRFIQGAPGSGSRPIPDPQQAQYPPELMSLGRGLVGYGHESAGQLKTGIEELASGLAGTGVSLARALRFPPRFGAAGELLDSPARTLYDSVSPALAMSEPWQYSEFSRDPRLLYAPAVAGAGLSMAVSGHPLDISGNLAAPPPLPPPSPRADTDTQGYQPVGGIFGLGGR